MDFLAQDVDGADQFVLLEHRDGEYRSIAAELGGFDDRSKPWLFGIGWRKVDAQSALVPDRITSRDCRIQFLVVDVPSSCTQ
jgi:hypothetical protein